MYNPRFPDIHSSQKERQLSNLLEAFGFVKFLSDDMYSDVLWLCEIGEEFWNRLFGKLLPEALLLEVAFGHWPTLFPKRKATSDSGDYLWLLQIWLPLVPPAFTHTRYQMTLTLYTIIAYFPTGIANFREDSVKKTRSNISFYLCHNPIIQFFIRII